jgi:glyoxylase-like metal-dependent hydrolase (beta-lactamase superfamily II)
VFEIYAVRYGYNGKRVSSENFVGGDEHDVPMPLDYFVWVIKGQNKTYVMDTGFDEAMGKKRDREVVRPVGEGLKAVGVDPATATDVIISHMHFDHAGNRDLFPNARYHVQDVEMAYCTGRCMCDDFQRHAFEPDDVSAMVRRLYEGRVEFHDGDFELEPGLTLHRIGGHTQGLQVARVQTERGQVVIASDASHFYANFENDRPFPSFHDINAMRAGYNRMRKLATSDDHIVPGHDPEVLTRYPAARAGLDGVVRLDLAPKPR